MQGPSEYFLKGASIEQYFEPLWCKPLTVLTTENWSVIICPSRGCMRWGLGGGGGAIRKKNEIFQQRECTFFLKSVHATETRVKTKFPHNLPSSRKLRRLNTRKVSVYVCKLELYTRILGLPLITYAAEQCDEYQIFPSQILDH